MRREVLFAFLLPAVMVVFSARLVLAEMSSTNYKIPADVVGGAGGESSSGNYLLQTNLGESIEGGRSVSSSYGVESGFIQSINSTITLSLGAGTVAFGSVNPGSTTTQTLTADTTTDAWNGYSLSIYEQAFDGTYCCEQLTHDTDKTTTVPDHSGTIASPSAMGANDGFGFTLTAGTCIASKWNSGASYAAAPASSTEFHNTGRQGSGCPGYQAPTGGADTTTLRYQFAPPTTQKSGGYSNKVTITATAAL